MNPVILHCFPPTAVDVAERFLRRHVVFAPVNGNGTGKNRPCARRKPYAAGSLEAVRKIRTKFVLQIPRYKACAAQKFRVRIQIRRRALKSAGKFLLRKMTGARFRFKRA